MAALTVTADKITVLDGVFERQDYTFVRSQGGNLREPINRAIREYLATPQWSQLLKRNLGKQ